MKRVSALLAVAIAATALSALGASAASANTVGVLCESAPTSHECLSKYPAGTKVTGTASEAVKITGTNNVVVGQCSASTIGFSYDGNSRLESPSMSLTGCTEPQTPAPSGSLELYWREPSDATFEGPELYVTLTVIGHTGTYALSHGGVELTGGTSPKLKLNGANLYGVSGNYLSGLRLWTSYNLSPTPIYVEKPVSHGILCESSGCGGSSQYPAGTEFTATQATGSNMLIRGPFGLTFTQCKASVLHLRYDGASELEYVSSSWSECSRPTSDASAGALVVKYKESGNELLGGVGQFVEVTSVPGYGTVTYGVTGEGIELVQGSSPQLKLNGATMVGGEGDPTAYMYGTYNLTPTPLFVGEA